MIHVFFCVGKNRVDLSARCFESWRDISNVELHSLYCPSTIEQQLRRVRAEYMSQSMDIKSYILADDDCVPPPTIHDAVDVAHDGFSRHRFGILSLYPDPHTINPWRPSGHLTTPIETPEYLEHYSVGGIRIIRTGSIDKWPTMRVDNPQYDDLHCAAIRDAGFRAGYLRRHHCVHLGADRSSIRR